PREAVLVRIAHLARHVDHVVATVAVRRKRHFDAEEGEIAQPRRQREDVHLAAGIVDVVLLVHVVPGKPEHRRERSAVGSAAAVADMQGPGRIRRYVFDLHLDALLGTASKGTAGRKHGAYDRRL